MRSTYLSLFLGLTIVHLFSSFSFGQMANNPIIYADVPDMAMVRVGDTYYMSSTTMHMNPGVPIMKSKDLVNWELISYCYATLSTSDSYSLNNGKSEYGHGSWASSIRYFKGNYYVTTFANTGKTYIYKTSNIETGPWSVSILNGAYHDSNLFFDDDDRVYLVYGQGDIKIIELTADVTAVKAGGLNKTLITNAGAVAGPIGLNAEGTQVLKYNGYYFINNICWPSGGMRTQIVHRSASLTGTYESKVILKDQGVAQGSFINTPEGKWYAYLFRDNGAVGRIPYLVPMTWQNNWPVLSAVPTTLDIPKGTGGLHNIVSSDEFSQAGPLKLAWQWNHNPVVNFWSLTQKSGFLRLTNERTDPNVLLTTNTLTQRTFGPKCTAYTAIDVSGMKDGDYAGMLALQKIHGFVGVKMSGTSKSIVMVAGDDVTGTPSEKASIPLNQTTVYVRVDCDFTNRTDKAYFFYSLNGTTWTAIGTTVQLSYTIPHFMGCRFGLFTYATKNVGGYADFDYFKIGTSITNIFAESSSAPIVSFTTPTNNAVYQTTSTIPFVLTATSATSTIARIDVYDGDKVVHQEYVAPYEFSLENLAEGLHTIKAIATDNAGKTAESSIVIQINVPQGPFNGTVHNIPGKIEAEEYDLGGEGFAFHEGDANGNQGGATFRTDEVDIEKCTDVGTGYNIGYGLKDEWLEYSVNVTNSGNYDVSLRVAKDGTGGLMHIEFDGVNVTGAITIPNTTGWQVWQTVTLPNIKLTAGAHIMKIVFDANYTNINFVEFKDVVTSLEMEKSSAFSVYPNPFGVEGLHLERAGLFAYKILDLNGKLIESGVAENSTLVGQELRSGVYFLCIEKQGDTSYYKVIKH